MAAACAGPRPRRLRRCPPGTCLQRRRWAAAPPAETNGHLRVGTYRSIWASPEVEISPALQFTLAEQLVELSPQDAQRLGIEQGAAVQVAQNGTRLAGRAAIRTGVPAGTAFLAAGIATDSANALTEAYVEVVKA